MLKNLLLCTFPGHDKGWRLRIQTQARGLKLSETLIQAGSALSVRVRILIVVVVGRGDYPGRNGACEKATCAHLTTWGGKEKLAGGGVKLESHLESSNNVEPR